ncbi:MAG: MarR family winged helix-turn-helix transcriptional regulator [Glutamicibacter ardleyensis]|uniref:MarR family winged helix-turn-helix transcriptional regulator n=1 Tax=Glutamicibacter ardleyensis TaxID=225894 RepID=UPI003F948556
MTGTSNTQATLKVTTDAWEALFRAQVAVMRKITTMPEFAKLSLREYDVLFNLRHAPENETRLVDLNKHLLISQPSLSRMITRLEERGLVSRCTDPSDQRASRLKLTEAGLAMQRDIGRAHVKQLHLLLGDAMTEEEFIELQRLSTKLHNAVE